MNEVGAKKSIQRLLSQNEDEIFFNIVRYGEQRKFEHVTRSTLTPAIGYYYAGISVTDKGYRAILESANDIIPIEIPRYSLNLTIVDYFGSVTGESELFEAMTDDFNLVTDRIMDLIRPPDSDIITYFYDDDNNRFRLVPDTQPRCENTPTYFPDAEDFQASMLAEITFDIEEC